MNVWYHDGTGKGSDLVAFETQYFNCSISEYLKVSCVNGCNEYTGSKIEHVICSIAAIFEH